MNFYENIEPAARKQDYEKTMQSVFEDMPELGSIVLQAMAYLNWPNSKTVEMSDPSIVKILGKRYLVFKNPSMAIYTNTWFILGKEKVVISGIDEVAERLSKY